MSFDCPEYTSDVDAMGTLRLIEAVKAHCPHAKFYQASSSEFYGVVPPRRMRTRRFIHEARTELRSNSDFGIQRMPVNRACLRVTGFCLIMSLPDAAKPL